VDRDDEHAADPAVIKGESQNVGVPPSKAFPYFRESHARRKNAQAPQSQRSFFRYLPVSPAARKTIGDRGIAVHANQTSKKGTKSSYV
jgi:hypothetical protein